jgi:hypothetical protein
MRGRCSENIVPDLEEIELQVRLVRRPGRSRHPEFEREAECIGAFFGLEPMLTVEPSSELGARSSELGSTYSGC